jgi:hypothetical protein
LFHSLKASSSTLSSSDPPNLFSCARFLLPESTGSTTAHVWHTTSLLVGSMVKKEERPQCRQRRGLLKSMVREPAAGTRCWRRLNQEDHASTPSGEMAVMINSTSG